MSVDRLVELYLEHARETYATREAQNLAATLGRLARRYGDLPAEDFRALRLTAFRETLIDEGLSRGYVNKAIGHVRRAYAWAVSLELVEPDTLESLRAVQGLRAGRTRALERPAVQPVTPEQIIATLEHLTPKVAAIVELLRLTGARTGEIRLMTNGEIDLRGDVWIYRPREHKTAYRDKRRAIPLDEPCQAVLNGALPGHPDAPPLFRPFMPEAYVFESRRGRPYGEASVRNAVAVACKRAGVPHWHPHQIRHRVITEAAAALADDPDAVRALAGHEHLKTTELYTHRDERAAIRAQAALRRAGSS